MYRIKLSLEFVKRKVAYLRTAFYNRILQQISNMGMTETMSIPVDSRGFLLKHRDGWQETHGVWVAFPRNERYGEYQTMKLTGLPRSIAVVKRAVGAVLEEAKSEREAFLERKKRREGHRWTTQKNTRVVVVTRTPQKGGNMFMGLDCENARDPSPKPVERLVNSIPVLGTKKTIALQGAWATGAPKSCTGASEETVVSWSDEPALGAWGDE